MDDGFVTVFEVSYLANGTLIWCAIYLFILSSFTFGFFRGKLKWRLKQPNHKRLFIALVLIWNVVTWSMCISQVRSANEYISALQSKWCEQVEGTVQLLHAQPWSGHGEPERILIGGREFSFRYNTLTMAYNRIVSHGGVLKSGVRARLHFLGNHILKVEIKSSDLKVLRN